MTYCDRNLLMKLLNEKSKNEIKMKMETYAYMTTDNTIRDQLPGGTPLKLGRGSRRYF